jgi:hypothetical protein
MDSDMGAQGLLGTLKVSSMAFGGVFLHDYGRGGSKATACIDVICLRLRQTGLC